MKRVFIALSLLAWTVVSAQAQTSNSPVVSNRIVLVIHGGAGTILKSQMTAEREKAYRDSLTFALKRGYAILKNGGTALDAVEATIKVLEDCPLFNAGKGAVFAHNGKNELDAAIMNGKTLEAGAVAGVTTIKNPISAARSVMEKSGHVMLIGKGAEEFAKGEGIEIVDPSYFYTEERWRSLQKAKKEDSLKAAGKAMKGSAILSNSGQNPDHKFGTVGAVALDRYGNLAAATSTGGMTNKKYGRVGDSPIIGAGTYANNETCAISCTGVGEVFMRLVVAKTVSDLIEFRHYSLQQAAEEVIMHKLGTFQGSGGLIGVDRQGNITMPFNTEGMYRGYMKEDGTVVVKVYAGE
ncbi:MAG: beta-aspartyl-peptidase [Bacteroidetes bacterium]|nr:MAG: beta-aspartyl-peptidase [Bacteroidota bacterium]